MLDRHHAQHQLFGAANKSIVLRLPAPYRYQERKALSVGSMANEFNARRTAPGKFEQTSTRPWCELLARHTGSHHQVLRIMHVISRQFKLNFSTIIKNMIRIALVRCKPFGFRGTAHHV
jgi:hypothetical protein